MLTLYSAVLLHRLQSTFLFVRVSQNPVHYNIQQSLMTASRLSTDNILQGALIPKLDKLTCKSLN